MPQVAFLAFPTLDDPRVQSVLALFTGWLRVNPNPQGVIDAFQRAYSGPFGAQIFDLSPLNTITVWIHYENKHLILSGGTVGTTHLPAMLASWINPSNNPAHLGIADCFWNAAQALLQQVNPAWVGDAQEWLFAGHSYGGAQLTALATIIRANRRGSIINGFSYGSPRPGNSTLQDNSLLYNWTRWYNDTDPVPRVPPHTSEAPLLSAVLDNQTQININLQVQPFTGRMILPDGTVQERELAPTGIVPTDVNLATWIAGSNCFGSQSHMAAEYVNRFDKMPVPVDNEPTTPSRPRITDTPEITTSRERIGQISRALAAVPTPVFPSDGLQFFPPVKGNRYKARKVSGEWYVFYDEDVFCFASSKRQARKIARAGNKQIAAIPAANAFA